VVQRSSHILSDIDAHVAQALEAGLREDGIDYTRLATARLG
jgi:pyruvate/2-oxoglutarate dehydrogenase complex dihydrolipoamide dehydrogenase (E3) component